MQERVMNNKNFIAGNYDTHFIEKNKEQLMSAKVDKDISDMAIIATFVDYLDKLGDSKNNKKEFTAAQSSWKNGVCSSNRF